MFLLLWMWRLSRKQRSILSQRELCFLWKRADVCCLFRRRETWTILSWFCVVWKHTTNFWNILLIWLWFYFVQIWFTSFTPSVNLLNSATKLCLDICFVVVFSHSESQIKKSSPLLLMKENNTKQTISRQIFSLTGMYKLYLFSFTLSLTP